MRLIEAFKNASEAFAWTMSNRHYDRYQTPYIKGEVTAIMRNAYTGSIEHTMEKKNLIVKDASILLARLIKDNTEVPHGALALAVGTGDVGWNPLAPPAATNTQRALYGEITRKTFSSTAFIDADGAPVAYPTNVVDLGTTFSESEAVGVLVEMGLLGGNISTNMAIQSPVSPPNGAYDPTVDLTESDTLINYLVFGAVSKPSTSTFSVTWRLSF